MAPQGTRSSIPYSQPVSLETAHLSREGGNGCLNGGPHAGVSYNKVGNNLATSHRYLDRWDFGCMPACWEFSLPPSDS